MIEKIIPFTVGNEKTVEKLVVASGEFRSVNIAHVILPQGEILPTHETDAIVYLILVRGEVMTQFDDEEQTSYSKGGIINVVKGVKMSIINKGAEIAEFFAVKTFE